MDRRQFIKTALLAALAFFLPKREPAPVAKSEDTLFGIPIVWINEPGLKQNDVILGDFDQVFTSHTKIRWWHEEKRSPFCIIGKAVELTDDDDSSIHVRFTEQNEAWRFVL